MGRNRKSPEEIVRKIFDSLGRTPKTKKRISDEIGSSWITTSNYLSLIVWIQNQQKIVSISDEENIELWRQESG